MSATVELSISPTRRIQKSPFFEATLRWGAQGVTVYNHMLMPTYYESYEAEYWKLTQNVTLWDVACERQVEITGKDALRFSEYLTPRDLSKCKVGQCKYAILTADDGGVVNDPVVLRLAENHFWFSIADSDVLLWARGLAQGMGMQVEIKEPDVSPLALQGPNHLPIMEELFGDWVKTLKFFYFRETDLDGIPLVVARSGWSKQGGFELYLRDGRYGEELWERIMAAGKKYDIAPATPNAIERIESGLLSYGKDMTLENNPFEIPVNRYLDLNKAADFSGKAALKRIEQEGVRQKLVGVEIAGDNLPANENHWPVVHQETSCGNVTSAIYSPRLKKNIAYAMVAVESAGLGTALQIETPTGMREGQVVPMPFI